MTKLDLQHQTRAAAFQTATSVRVRTAALPIARQISGRLLDIGCGNGLFLLEYYAVAENKTIAFGLDYDRRAIFEARTLFKDNRAPAERLMIGDGFNLPFAAEQFEAVFCLNTLINIHPFSRIEVLLSEMYRVCKKGGCIIFDYRNNRNPYLWLQYRINSLTGRLTTHGHSRREFQPLVQKLNIKKSERIAIPSPLPGFPLGYLTIWEK
ncbi:MAG: class I SAM-dependent methyltransferase [Candidatus Marinimicrobia bacterium]|jgi:ubiquinone/menaquinone biosynthesis C-methylase UbiE|nr:class I SAM-dependent methyltransferase [Candidatus Neomarinimicrobiota bacterium]MCK9484060.1 class I SAM-dependent methyltransferase [Candidatus Neomarinimicrobiota bacterium]MCK9559653.1 class I SAM-dependent methyltransferase [Candidatus Neomarinimicrobiota bacterium]